MSNNETPKLSAELKLKFYNLIGTTWLKLLAFDCLKALIKIGKKSDE